MGLLRRILGSTVLASILTGSGLATSPRGTAFSQETISAAASDLRSDLRGDLRSDLRGDLLQDFVVRLEELRSGESDETAELVQLGQDACDRFERCDVLALAEFYSGLSEDERRLGYEHELEFRAFWDRVLDANAAGLSDDDWSEAREPLLLELEDLAGRAATLADPSPAARAWSLLGRLGLAELRSETLLPAEERELILTCRDRAERAAAQFLRAGYVTPRLEPLWLLARLDKFEGQSDRARQAFGEVLALARSVGSVDFQLHALAGLSDLARSRGDAHAVDLCLSRMAELRPPSSEGTGFRLALRHAMRLIHQDEPKAALIFLGRHRPESSADLTSWHLACASAHTRLDELGAALEALAAAQKLEDTRQSAPADRWNLELVRARIELAAGRYSQALSILDRCSGEADLDVEPQSPPLARLPEEARLELCAMRGEALLHLAGYEEARSELERALQLAHEINTSLEPDSTWRSEAERIGAFAARANVLGEALGIHRLVLLAEANLLLGDAMRAAHEIERAQSSGLRRGSNSRDVDVAAWAESVELGLVTWAVGPDETVVCDLTRVGRRGDLRATGRVIPIGRSAVQRAVRRLREAILANDLTRARRLGREFATAMFPLSRLEPLRRGRRLYSLHGPLEELPLEWLLAEGLIGPSDRDPEAASSIRTVPLVLPGVTATRPGSPVATPLRWTLLGDPRGPRGEVLLPGALDELRDLTALHPGAVELGGHEFTRAAVQAVLQLPPLGTGALHIATHLTREGERRSDGPGAPLAGELGLLCSAGEMLHHTDLRRAAPHFRLAVLSACTTGGGRFIDGEGLHGVARALLSGGTRNIVVTLWPVEDRAAQRFSVALHRSLSRGRAPSVAVHEARADLRGAGLPPADWAAFRLLGRD